SGGRRSGGSCFRAYADGHEMTSSSNRGACVGIYLSIRLPSWRVEAAVGTAYARRPALVQELDRGEGRGGLLVEVHAPARGVGGVEVALAHGRRAGEDLVG